MCGRFTLATPAEIVAEFFELPGAPELTPRYNVAPTQNIAGVVRPEGSAQRELRWFHWGLIPSWAKDAKLAAKMINARAETVADKPAFRSAFRSRRCLIIADGFYEWKKLDRGKQPYLMRMADGGPFALAGLWERWHDLAGQVIESATLITTEPNDLLRDIHDRMPVILDRCDYECWLDPANHDARALCGLLRPFDPLRMTAAPCKPPSQSSAAR